MTARMSPALPRSADTNRGLAGEVARNRREDFRGHQEEPPADQLIMLFQTRPIAANGSSKCESAATGQPEHGRGSRSSSGMVLTDGRS